MLLNLGSFLLIVLLSAYQIFSGFRGKGRKVRNISTSVFSFLSALAFGAIAAQTFDWGISILLLISVVFAIVVGYMGGAAFGLQKAIQGALSGTLGAMLGTVAGSLFYKSNNVVLAAAIVFIVGSFLIQKIKERLDAGRLKSKAATQKKPTYRGTVILAVCAVMGAGVMFTAINQIHIGAIGAPASQIAVFDEENDLQIASIDVTSSGMIPVNTEFKANTMIKAVFNVKSNAGTDLKLVSKDLNFSADLKPGENMFLLNNPQPGTYEIVEPGKAFKSTFTVKGGQAK
ncbi:hypothetical protein [Paenibacillus sp. RC67]|uniref:hypothetical protein n=1 Tax=Paenibacillus sp. RC67 TaxID=3039392 RepID=UPI0024ADE970|nr:hypothetical protein [Paenibacillus sp. RC67]